jgi:dUTP pyrophosphatase
MNNVGYICKYCDSTVIPQHYGIYAVLGICGFCRDKKEINDTTIGYAQNGNNRIFEPNLSVGIKMIDDQCFMPKKKSFGASCFDCYARQSFELLPSQIVRIPLGFCMDLPQGLEAQIRPRSGLSLEGIIVIPGTVDSDYRGEVCAIVLNMDKTTRRVRQDDRIAQMAIARVIDCDFQVVTELSITERGDNGFGSTGI